MPDMWVDVDTALAEVPVNIASLIDDTDFKSRETGIVYNSAGMDLVWNFVTTAGAFTQTAVTPTTAGDYDWTHQGDGMYTIEIPASGGASINNDTEGFGWFTGVVTGVLPWRGPVIGFRAAALNNALIDGGDNLDVNVTQWLGTAVATPTTAGVPEVDVTYISGDSGAADSLELQYDGTGLTGDTYPATQAQVGNIASGTSAISTVASSYTLTTGTQSSGTYTDTETRDGTPHQHTDTAGAMELYYEFDLGGNGVASECNMFGYLTGGNDTLTVYAYDWAGTAWDPIGTLGGGAASNSENSYNLLNRHTGTGANLGLVRVRFYAASGLTSATLSIDQIITSFAVVFKSVGYDGGQVWIDTVGGTAGTESFVNGVADNPVDSWADALTIASNVGLGSYRGTADSSITLAATFSDSVLSGHDTSLALGGQNISGSHFYDMNVSGTGTGTSTINFHSCHVGTCTLHEAHFYDCSFSSTLTLGEAADYILTDCYSEVAGAGAPIIDMGAAIGATNLNIRRWAGGLTLNNLATGDVVTLDGIFGTITLNGADAQVEIRGIAKAVVNNLTGSPTVNDDTVKADDIADILTDTSDIQPKIGTPVVDLSSDIADVKSDIAALNDISVADILTTQMTESYAADGSAPSLAEALFAIQQFLQERNVTGTTLTVRKLDGVTTAMTFTLDDGTSPTDLTRAT